MSYKSLIAAKLLIFYRAIFDGSGLTAARTYALPDKSGTVALLTDLPTTTGDMIKRTLITTVGTTYLAPQTSTRYALVTVVAGGNSGARVASGSGAYGGAGGGAAINVPIHNINGGQFTAVVGVGGASATVNGGVGSGNPGGVSSVQYGTQTVSVLGGVAGSCQMSASIISLRARPLVSTFGVALDRPHLVDATNTDYIDSTNGVIVSSPYYWVGAGARYNSAGAGNAYNGGAFWGNPGGTGFSIYVGGGGGSLFGAGGNAPNGYNLPGNMGTGYGAGGSGAVNANSGAGYQGCVIIAEYA